MAEHTSGPWGILEVGSGWSVLPVNARGKPRNGRDTKDIAQGNSEGNWRSDATLIKAAPDLLAALCEITNLFKVAVESNVDIPGFDAEEHGAIKQARAAIAKATGAQP